MESAKKLFHCQTNFGFTKLGSNMHSFRVKALSNWKIWSGTPCISGFCFVSLFRKNILPLKSSWVPIVFFLKWLTKPKPEIFFDYNGNESCKGGPKQNFGKSWHYWVNSVALSKEKKKGCFYTVLGTCQKTFVTGCMYFLDYFFQILCQFFQI